MWQIIRPLPRSFHLKVTQEFWQCYSSAPCQLTPIESLAKVECFLEEDSPVNITQHELVHKRILLSHEEKTALPKSYRPKETQPPPILPKGSVAKYLPASCHLASSRFQEARPEFEERRGRRPRTFHFRTGKGDGSL
ncbi:rna polymerase rpb5 domain-containing protein [Colletotrichum incanum]|uniref:Rna polymerase rpb5 domain-containing protein n=1 Tax=Colletotrichum incanum TaxID=1573173 RepID=A0A167ABL8_COLIC|nr:rna polymerase rpb5 domain-containing protein [Colletotrichum incanum]